MYKVREGRITTYFSLKINVYKNTTWSIMELTRENLKFEISAQGAYSRIYGIYRGCRNHRATHECLRLNSDSSPVASLIRFFPPLPKPPCALCLPNFLRGCEW